MKLAEIYEIDKRAKAVVQEAVGIGMRSPGRDNVAKYLGGLIDRMRTIVGDEARDERLRNSKAWHAVHTAVVSGLGCGKVWYELQAEANASGRSAAWAMGQFRKRFGASPMMLQTRRESAMARMGA